MEKLIEASVNHHLPIASSSSIKIIAGAFSFANEKASRTSFAPSPMNICTSCGPASLRKVDFVWAAHALARRVFPVPGAPYRSTPGMETQNKNRSCHLSNQEELLQYFYYWPLNYHSDSSKPGLASVIVTPKQSTRAVMWFPNSPVIANLIWRVSPENCTPSTSIEFTVFTECTPPPSVLF